MTKGPWKYQKAQGHHHVLMGKEVLDVNSESDAKLIAKVPNMIALLRLVAKERRAMQLDMYARGIETFLNELLEKK